MSCGHESCILHITDCCSTLEQLQIANETLQNENKRLISEMDELRTQVGSCVFIIQTYLACHFINLLLYIY